MGQFHHLLRKLWILYLFHKALGLADDSDVFVNSSCFNTSDWSLAAVCGGGFMVQLHGVMFGYSAQGQCRPSPGDCMLEDSEIHHCVGQSTCQINLPTGQLGRNIPKCDQHSNYMAITYSCVAENLVVDICRQGVLTAQSGYVSSPHYPINYPAGVSCELNILAQPSQHIKLYTIDFDLDASCNDSLYLKSPLAASTRCGRKGPGLLFTTFENELTLKFNSDHYGNNKGFWLYYEADPPVPPTTSSPSTSQFTTSTVDGSTVVQFQYHGEVSQTSTGQPQEATVTPIPNALPIEAIVGSVIGCLVLLLLLLLIFIIIKRHKERDMSSSTSTCYLHGKSCTTIVTPSGTTAPYIQNILDNPQPATICTT